MKRLAPHAIERKMLRNRHFNIGIVERIIPTADALGRDSDDCSEPKCKNKNTLKLPENEPSVWSCRSQGYVMEMRSERRLDYNLCTFLHSETQEIWTLESNEKQ